MAIVSGPELDKIAKEAKEWYLEMREYLIKALEGDDYPFGSVRLSLTEQVAKYDSMTPMDWSTMIENLYKRYKGRQGALKLVGDDIARYRGRMERLKARMGYNG